MEKKAANRMAMALGSAQFGFLVAAGLLGGLWVDSKTGTMPLFGLLGLVIGFIGGIRMVLRLQKEIKKDES